MFMFSGQGSHYSILPEAASFPDQGTTFTVTFPHTIPEYSCVWNVVTRKILPLRRRMKKSASLSERCVRIRDACA